MRIINTLKNTISTLIKENHVILSEKQKIILEKETEYLKTDEINKHIVTLREFNIFIQQYIIKNQLRHNLSKLREYISILREKISIKKLSPEDFEQLLVNVLRIINDENYIKPNYPVDDLGNPISHASGNKADIECFYENYNTICEVTKDSSNFQWIRESQPVMRHLREFENLYEDKKSYCLFIAPKVHEDTIYHFWNSVKNGYNGKKQYIIPLSTEQLSIWLEGILSIFQNKQSLSHVDISKMYENIIKLVDSVSGHSEWKEKIDSAILEWKLGYLK